MLFGLDVFVVDVVFLHTEWFSTLLTRTVSSQAENLNSWISSKTSQTSMWDDDRVSSASRSAFLRSRQIKVRVTEFVCASKMASHYERLAFLSQTIKVALNQCFYTTINHVLH